MSRSLVTAGLPAENTSADAQPRKARLRSARFRRCLCLDRQGSTTHASGLAQTADQGVGGFQCDTVSSNTWWSGTRFAKRAADWTKLLTDGKGDYCTAQQEDNALLAALMRGEQNQRLDFRRVAVLRAGSNFDQPYPGQSSVEALTNASEQGGYGPATENLFRAAKPVIDAIVADWQHWRLGPPAK